MRFKLDIALLILTLFSLSCDQKNKYGNPAEKPSAILKNIRSFLEYRDKNIKLYQEFIGLDSGSTIIPKESFLKSLSTGNYVPLKLTSKDSTIYYQLNKLEDSVDNDIKSTIQYWGLQEYDYYKLEGTEFPNSKFVDMEGNIYDKASTRGKIVVIKCWFLACLPCVQEMPVLNELKEQFRNQKDVLFISLCWDPKDQVASFLKKNTFTYATVPDQYKFMTETLGLNGYPTHFILNKDGKIYKKTQDCREMIYTLKKLTSQ